MNKKIVLISAAIIFVISYYIITFNRGNGYSHENSLHEWRIVSLSPVITEMLYASGLGEQIVANTNFCLYPPEAANKAKIGSLSNINYEYALSLGINAAVVYKGATKEKEIFENLGIKTVEINTDSIESILSSFDAIGTAFNKKETTDKEKNRIIAELNKYKINNFNGKKPKVLTVVFRPDGTKGIQSVTAAGATGIYNDILTMLGAENALQDKRPYPEISKEGIININPDIIIEVSFKMSSGKISDWDNLKNTVNAVKNGCVYMSNDTVMSLPGPRLPIIVDFFANILSSDEKCLK